VPGAGRISRYSRRHAFAAELAAEEIPVAAPLVLAATTLHRHREFDWAAFPLCAGTAPELDQPGARELLGRTLARIHAVGARRRFQYRPTLERALLGARARASMLRSALMPDHMRQQYADGKCHAGERHRGRIRRAWGPDADPPARRLPSRQHPVAAARPVAGRSG